MTNTVNNLDGRWREGEVRGRQRGDKERKTANISKLSEILIVTEIIQNQLT